MSPTCSVGAALARTLLRSSLRILRQSKINLVPALRLTS